MDYDAPKHPYQRRRKKSKVTSMKSFCERKVVKTTLLSVLINMHWLSQRILFKIADILLVQNNVIFRT